MNRATAIRYRTAIVEGAQELPDVQAIDVPLIFERWHEGIDYSMGDRICYEEVLYKCVQAHRSQSDWLPSITPNLWTVVSADEWPEWVQPTGAQDAYMAGDKVSYNGKHYICIIDYNIYAPDVYGWEEA